MADMKKVYDDLININLYQGHKVRHNKPRYLRSFIKVQAAVAFANTYLSMYFLDFQGFWTPPEEAADFQLPNFQPLDPSKMGNLPPELVRNSQGQRMSAWNQQGRPDLYSQSSFPPPPPGGAGGIPQQPPFRYPLSEYLPQGTALFFFQFCYFFEHKRQLQDKWYFVTKIVLT